MLPIDDDEDADISSKFSMCNEFIKVNLATTNVLVHCLAGISRSATVTIAYIMSEMNMSFSEAFALVKKQR